MAKLVSVFISRRHRRLIGFAVWVLCFLGVLSVLGWLALERTNDVIQAELREGIGHYMRLRESVVSTFDAMDAELTAQPCTAAFNDQLRKIAYRPDGLSEFLYAPGGLVYCSTQKVFDVPVDLGRPDIPPAGERGVALWIDRDLSFLDLKDLRGTVVTNGPYATIIPSQDVQIGGYDWLDLQIVVASRDGRWWHRQGSPGVYERLKIAEAAGGPFPSGRFLYELLCDPKGIHCVAAEADAAVLLAKFPGSVLVVLLLAGLVASYVTNQTNRLITRYWSFEARFRRHLDADSIVCAYQPVMALDSGRIIGCEILARWRDIDDTIVFPDRFMAIVERNGLTKRLTELVAQKAYKELSERLPESARLQVNFNIFPSDLDCGELMRIFSDFLSRPERFDVVLEIVECNEFPPNAQREIDALREAGIKTYIDDFGTGYSNMENLATLSVDGVKLDRSFAMAPDDSLMARMLGHAVEMIQATGRVMVVEGIETPERLRMLREMAAQIDHVQGYFISRPLDIATFAEFLAKRTRSPDIASGREAA